MSDVVKIVNNNIEYTRREQKKAAETMARNQREIEELKVNEGLDRGNRTIGMTRMRSRAKVKAICDLKNNSKDISLSIQICYNNDLKTFSIGF